MRVRHKQPTIVSMWMLDVFCCALGCVTLLWLMNSRFASEKAEAAQSAVRELLHTQSARESVQKELTLAQRTLDRNREQAEAEIRALTVRLGELAAVRQKLETEAKILNEQLATKTKEQTDLARELAERQTRLDKYDRDSKELRTMIEDRMNDIARAATKQKLTEEKLASTQQELLSTRTQFAMASDKLTKTQAELATVGASLEKFSKLAAQKSDERAAADKTIASLESQLRDARQDASTARASTTTQVQDLEKRLADAKAMLVDLQGDKRQLADKYDRLQKDSENRFAGITMTGKRVVFLVDRSGSMDRTSEQTLSPAKWPAVAETVAKVMRTLPNIEQFQVVVFSKQPQWLLGAGEWQPYVAEKSADAVKTALLRTKVEGDTNLFTAFELAFQLRDRGLDTIYLFSDGLPTSGPGLSDELLRRNPPPTVTEQTDVLARHVRTQLTSVWNRAFTNQPKVRINAIGFFYESPDLGAFLWALARENDGSFVGMSRP